MATFVAIVVVEKGLDWICSGEDREAVAEDLRDWIDSNLPDTYVQASWVQEVTNFEQHDLDQIQNRTRNPVNLVNAIRAVEKGTSQADNLWEELIDLVGEEEAERLVNE